MAHSWNKICGIYFSRWDKIPDSQKFKRKVLFWLTVLEVSIYIWLDSRQGDTQRASQRRNSPWCGRGRQEAVKQKAAPKPRSLLFLSLIFYPARKHSTHTEAGPSHDLLPELCQSSQQTHLVVTHPWFQHHTLQMQPPLKVSCTIASGFGGTSRHKSVHKLSSIYLVAFYTILVDSGLVMWVSLKFVLCCHHDSRKLNRMTESNLKRKRKSPVFKNSLVRYHLGSCFMKVRMKQWSASVRTPGFHRTEDSMCVPLAENISIIHPDPSSLYHVSRLPPQRTATWANGS